jgi:hypothetical protein
MGANNIRIAHRSQITTAKAERLRRYRVMIDALLDGDKTPSELAAHAQCHVANARELIQAMMYFGLVRRVSVAHSTPIGQPAIYALADESKIGAFFDFINVCQSVMEERGLLDTIDDEIEAKRDSKDIKPFRDPLVAAFFGPVVKVAA